MRAGFNKWWLLPVGILGCCAMVSLTIVVFGSSFVARSSAEPASQADERASEADGGCSGVLASDYACQQERYQDLVRDSDVEAAFTELKDEYETNEFVRSNCHQITHVIGRAAAERYGDIPSAYSRGDDFCISGYYHGVMEAVVARIGADKILDEADTLCAELREREPRSDYHYACAHGLGHGFMGILENELFESLGACETLTDGWERDVCAGGVFMENYIARDNPSHPSKYLKADQPLYPCTDVATPYKERCYEAYVEDEIDTRGNDFAEVFGVCATEAEDDFRPVCYRALGEQAVWQSIEHNATDDVAQTGSARTLCKLGQDYEARAYCVIGAVNQLSDEQAKALCESLKNSDLRAVCLQEKNEENPEESRRLDS